jgi:TolB-like protein/predicted Zn-dependent protease
MKTFVEELKSRRVYRVALAYIIAGSAMVQVVGTVLPMFHAPDWAQQVFVILIALGFPIALLLGWSFDVEAGTIKKARLGRGRTAVTNRRRAWIVAAVGLVIAMFGVGSYWFWHPWTTDLRLEPAAIFPIAEKSIAVLPFENLSDEKQNSFFADGVQDEILTNLAKVADLKVISRTSVMQYKTGIERNLREIAKALGVAHVVEGTVQRADGRIRVNAQLIDARTDTHVWGEQYDRNLADVFAIETELAEKIVAQLKSKLSPNEKAAIEEKPTDDLSAHDLYIRAKTLIETSVFSTPQQESLSEAIRLLDQAIERDPGFALAYYQLAQAHDLLYFIAIDHTAERLAKADAALQSLIRLRPDSGEAHLGMARHFYWGYLNYDRAREELTLAQKTLPNDPVPFQLLGYIDRRQGRWEESVKNLERAIELDPRNPAFLQQISRSYACLRRYADVARALDRALALTPNDPSLRAPRAELEITWHADPRPLISVVQGVFAEDPKQAINIADFALNAYLCARDFEGARRALGALSSEGCHEESIPFPREWCQGLVARLSGDKTAAHAAFSKARQELAKLVREQPDYAEGLCALGMVDAALGRKENAIREGRRAVELLPVTKDAIIGPILVQNLAVIYAWVGEKDAALEQLNIATRMPSFLSYGSLRLHPYWDPLRGDQRFDKIVASLARK